MRVALDTNILAYAEGIDDAGRRDAALALVTRIPQLTVFLPAQVLGELFVVLTRKGGRSAREARETVLGWRDAFALIETTQAVLVSAMDLADSHRFSMWDAIILAAAAEAECRLLLSEGMQQGFTWNGVTIANPFSETRHPLLDAMLADADRWNAEK
ncbi:MAG TPA: PIN domain-containing protein [Rhodanobacteraceae bacterium]|jgi:predicted nucleic acid-binding protein|nr:PIN domain-containing protein [Rhodanobacteraceae bacterium]